MPKIHRNTHLRPKSSVRDQVPKVAMEDPLTARKPEQFCLLFRSLGEGGTMLTSAPVSMRKNDDQSWHRVKTADDLLIGQDRSSPLATGRGVFRLLTRG